MLRTALTRALGAPAAARAGAARRCGILAILAPDAAAAADGRLDEAAANPAFQVQPVEMKIDGPAIALIAF